MQRSVHVGGDKMQACGEVGLEGLRQKLRWQPNAEYPANCLELVFTDFTANKAFQFFGRFVRAEQI